MTEDIVKRLEAACIDWNTAKMIDETRPADWLTVGDVRDAVAEIQRLTSERAALRAALSVAIRQNEHDMLMAGEELRACRAALESGDD